MRISKSLELVKKLSIGEAAQRQLAITHNITACSYQPKFSVASLISIPTKYTVSNIIIAIHGAMKSPESIAKGHARITISKNDVSKRERHGGIAENAARVDLSIGGHNVWISIRHNKIIHKTYENHKKNDAQRGERHSGIAENAP